MSCFISFIDLIIQLTVYYRSHALSFMFIRARRPEDRKKLFSTCFAHLHLVACRLWQSINPSLAFPRRKRILAIYKNDLVPPLHSMYSLGHFSSEVTLEHSVVYWGGTTQSSWAFMCIMIPYSCSLTPINGIRLLKRVSYSSTVDFCL